MSSHHTSLGLALILSALSCGAVGRIKNLSCVVSEFLFLLRALLVLHLVTRIQLHIQDLYQPPFPHPPRTTAMLSLRNAQFLL